MAKVRLDYVSNSSSSSFVVNDTKKLLACMTKDFHDTSMPWELSDKIYVSFFCRERDAKELEDYFNCNPDYVYKKYADHDFDHKWPIGLDDEHWFYSVDVTQFFDCPAKIFKKIASPVTVMTSEENDEFGKMILRLMAYYCKMKKIDIDLKGSEIDFLDEADDFFSKLFSIAAGKKISGKHDDKTKEKKQ